MPQPLYPGVRTPNTHRIRYCVASEPVWTHNVKRQIILSLLGTESQLPAASHFNQLLAMPVWLLRYIFYDAPFGRNRVIYISDIYKFLDLFD
jgi:hypothetical protein